MYKLFLITIIIISIPSYGMDNHGNHNHSDHHHNHQHDSNAGIDGSLTQLDEKMYQQFISDINDGQVAIVDVNGMVCDFCARGIEKTFYRDEMVKKIRVSLESGKVLIAYSNSKKISFEEIAKIFLDNGQTAVGFELRKL
jgi:hypothetical protein